jgi:hypothetical protein
VIIIEQGIKGTKELRELRVVNKGVRNTKNSEQIIRAKAPRYFAA